jgi:hypothetical protein
MLILFELIIDLTYKHQPLLIIHTKKKREAYAIVTYIMVSPYLYPGNEQQPHASL